MHWTTLWLHLFGTTTFDGLDIGFWLSLGLVLFIVVAMNVLFWTLATRNKHRHHKKTAPFIKRKYHHQI